MAGMSRRNVISGIAVSGGFAMAQMGAAQCQRRCAAAFRADAGAAQRQGAALLQVRARRPVRQGLGRRLVEGGDGRRVPGVGEARRRPDAAFPRRAARAALARQRRRMGLRHQGPLPRHHHRPAGAFRDRRLRCRRRLVLPARARPLDPGPRTRRLPVPPRLRQRLLLRVRHLQHHGLAGSHAPRGAGQELRRAGVDLRGLPEARGLHGQGAGAGAAALRSRARLAQRRRRHAPLSPAGPAAREVRRRLAAAGLGARVPDLHDGDRRADAHQAGRAARAALASQRGRVAVLHQGSRAHDGVRLARPRAHRGVRRRRRRLRAAGLRPLHRERRQRGRGAGAGAQQRQLRVRSRSPPGWRRRRARCSPPTSACPRRRSQPSPSARR